MSYTDQVGWTIQQWTKASGISRSRLYELIADGRVQSKKLFKRRLITTSPSEFLDSLPEHPLTLRPGWRKSITNRVTV